MSEEKKAISAPDEGALRPEDVPAGFIDENQERQEELAAQAAKAQAANVTLTETDVHMVGDRVVIAQVVQLLAYIRHAVKNNMKTDVKVEIGGTVANSEFMFDVNGCQVPDLITQQVAKVN